MHALATATLLATSLFATAASADVVWLCQLTSDGVHLACVAEADPLAALDAAPVEVARVNGTSFPLTPGRLYTVDLWSPPTDMDRVEELARATICYRTKGCTVMLTGVQTPVALLRERSRAR